MKSTRDSCADRAAKEVLLDLLEQNGTKYVFGNPGTTEQGFLASLSQRSDLKYMMALQEGVSIAMADGYSRATGRPSFVNLHITAGVANGISQLYNASFGRSPMVVTAGQSPSRLLIHEPLLYSDLTQLVRQFTKWSWEVRHPEDVPIALQRAFKFAMQPPQGPVFLSFPIDLLDELIPPMSPGSWPDWSEETRPGKGSVDAAVEMLLRAKAPIILCGDDVARREATPDLVELAEATGASVYATMQTDISFPNDHHLFVRTLNLNSSRTRDVLSEADLIIAIGTPLFSQFLDTGSHLMPEGIPLIHIDESGWEVGKNYPVSVGVIGGLRSVCQELIAGLNARASGQYKESARNRSKASKQRKMSVRARMQDQSVESGPGVTPLGLMTAIRQAASPDVVIVDEAITNAGTLHKVFQFSRPGSLFGQRGGSLGWGLPGALGVQLGLPDRQVVAVVGDGAAMYSIQALWTTAHYALPVKYIICSNHSYDILKANMTNYLGESATASHFLEMDLVNPVINFVEVSRGLGVPSVAAATPGQLEDALDVAFSSAGPYLVDVTLAGRKGD